MTVQKLLVIFSTFVQSKQLLMKFTGIIPARYSSSRFPGKVLAMLAGKPVVQHVYERVASVITDVYVATDDQRILDAVVAFGGKAVMTSLNHKSGTDRIGEAIGKIGGNYDVIVNIQGDEPFIQKSHIEAVCQCFDDDDAQIATLGKRFTSMDEVKNVNSPKIVLDNKGYAMYFSRSVIPFIRNAMHDDWTLEYPFLKHIGIYAYRTNVLSEIIALEQSPLELAESLEQLRWLQNGYRIKVGFTDIETIGIDTPNDLKKAEKYIKERRV